MSVQIIKAGIMDTIQDLGRYGYQYLGINPSGAMDKYAMKIANALVGNNPDEAVIELHFPASVFLFKQPSLIALSGANFMASINGEFVPHLHPVWVNKNDVLQFHKPVEGARAYLAVAGGFKIEPWLGSRSTNLKAGCGGYNGRVLQKGDVILYRQPFPYTPDELNFRVLPWSADVNWGDIMKEIAILPGNEWDYLTATAKEGLVLTDFVITNQSDRMGYRLQHTPFSCTLNEELLSSSVHFGTVQLLPDGSLIILMADHQTTGGYPRVAYVISAHHSRLAQLKAGDTIRFCITDAHTAETLWLKQQQHLLQLQYACTFRLAQYFHVRDYKL